MYPKPTIPGERPWKKTFRIYPPTDETTKKNGRYPKRHPAEPLTPPLPGRGPIWKKGGKPRPYVRKQTIPQPIPGGKSLDALGGYKKLWQWLGNILSWFDWESLRRNQILATKIRKLPVYKTVLCKRKRIEKKPDEAVGSTENRLDRRLFGSVRQVSRDIPAGNEYIMPGTTMTQANQTELCAQIHVWDVWTWSTSRDPCWPLRRQILSSTVPKYFNGAPGFFSGRLPPSQCPVKFCTV